MSIGIAFARAHFTKPAISSLSVMSLILSSSLMGRQGSAPSPILAVHFRCRVTEPPPLGRPANNVGRLTKLAPPSPFLVGVVHTPLVAHAGFDTGLAGHEPAMLLTSQSVSYKLSATYIESKRADHEVRRGARWLLVLVRLRTILCGTGTCIGYACI